MKNLEFYKDIINAIPFDYLTISGGALKKCSSESCTKCIFKETCRVSLCGQTTHKNTSFNTIIIEWLNSEYIDPITFEDLMDDDPIYYSNTGDDWKPAHFAKIIKGKVFVYSDGKSKHTAEGAIKPVNFIKLK